MFAFCCVRFAVIKDSRSRVSIMIGVLGLGQGIAWDEVLVFEKMFSICFIKEERFYCYLFVCFIFAKNL